MKQAILLHNPGAGDENHVQEDLTKAIIKNGFGCTYFSIKEEEWKNHLEYADFAIVAGGDGTVKTVAKELLKKNALEKKIPIALLPMGTANNLAKNFNIEKSIDVNLSIKRWLNPKLQPFDVGVVISEENSEFFLESFGLGIFPHLIKQMKDKSDKKKNLTANEEITFALKVLKDMILSEPSVACELQFNNQTIEGKYLLVEVMNIKTIGPNLLLAPHAVTDDGLFNIALIEEKQRNLFTTHLNNLISGKPSRFDYINYHTKTLTLNTQTKSMHLDDQLIKPYLNPIKVEVREKVIDFMV